MIAPKTETQWMSLLIAWPIIFHQYWLAPSFPELFQFVVESKEVALQLLHHSEKVKKKEREKVSLMSPQLAFKNEFLQNKPVLFFHSW